jgi:hypothetical protein
MLLLTPAQFVQKTDVQETNVQEAEPFPKIITYE